MGQFKDLRKAAFAVGFGATLGVHFGKTVGMVCNTLAAKWCVKQITELGKESKDRNVDQEDIVEPVTSNEI